MLKIVILFIIAFSNMAIGSDFSSLNPQGDCGVCFGKSCDLKDNREHIKESISLPDQNVQSVISMRNHGSIQYLNDRINQLKYLYASVQLAPQDYELILRLISEIKQYENALSVNAHIETEAQYYINLAVQYAKDQENRGDWKSSYEIYRWLISIDLNNPEVTPHAKELAERIQVLNTIIEFLKTDGSVKPEQVNAELADRIFDLLDRDYVSLVKYDVLAESAVKRCELVGEVIVKSSAGNQDCSKEKMEKWNRGVRSLYFNLSENESWDHDQYMTFINKILLVNKQTINISDSVLLYSVIEAGLRSLDTHTSLLLPSQWDVIDRQLSNNIAGIGVILSKDRNRVIIEDIYPETPAVFSDLRPGDNILEVNGKSVEGMDLDDVVRIITGPVNTVVTVTSQNREGQTKKVSLHRQQIEVPDITGWIRISRQDWSYQLDPDLHIGYIQIKNFTHKTYSEFADIMGVLENNVLDGLILDLRSNLGGDVKSSVSIADYYLDDGLILRGQPRCGAATYYMARKKTIGRHYPIAVLVNNRTASAAEILAGSLQDPKHRRATLVGERTYGKNTIQVITSVPKTNMKIKYSTATYYFSPGQEIVARPSGFDINTENYGLKPNVEIKLLPHEISLIEDIQQKNLESVWNNGSLSKQEISSFYEDIMLTDTQLNIALAMVKKSIHGQSH